MFRLEEPVSKAFSAKADGVDGPRTLRRSLRGPVKRRRRLVRRWRDSNKSEDRPACSIKKYLFQKSLICFHWGLSVGSPPACERHASSPQLPPLL